MNETPLRDAILRDMVTWLLIGLTLAVTAWVVWVAFVVDVVECVRRRWRR